jgi:hypothetical protein
MTVFRMDVTAEAKDDETGEGVLPHLPDPLSAAVAVQDTMANLTKHDGRFGWRITQVRPAQAGTAVVSAADLRHVLDQVTAVIGPYAEAAAALREQLTASRAEQQP